MEKESLERPQIALTNVSAPAEPAGENTIDADTQDKEISLQEAILSAGGEGSSPSEVRQGSRTGTSRLKIGPCQGRGQFILIFLSFFSSLVLLLMLAAYQTEWGREILPSEYIQFAAATSLLLTGLVVLMLWRFQRHRRTVQAIEANLREIARVSEYEEVFRQLEPFPSRAEMPTVASGWNRLVAAVDTLREQNLMKQTGENLGQFLCSYDSQKLLGILDSLPDGIILADAQGLIIMSNRSCEGKLGRTLSEFIGQSVLELFDDPQAKKTLEELLAGNTAQTDDYFEVVFTPRNGDSFTTGQTKTSEESEETQNESSLEHLLQSEGAVLWVCCHRLASEREDSDILLILRDITQQKVSEAGRDAFIAHVSHELRSPLTNIRAYAETLLSDMELDARAQKESFNVINEETARLIRLVNDILDLSHMETGSFHLDKGEVVLDRLVRQCVSDVRASASSKKITLQTNYHPKLPNLSADREKLAVVINNILTNAIKYTPESGTVFVETNVDDRYVYIKVTDTGIGISSEDIDRIFEKFYRVDREETAEITGTGLGLAICKEIINMHGGTINVTSEMDKGTEMEIKLPLTQTGPVLGPALQEKNGEQL